MEIKDLKDSIKKYLVAAANMTPPKENTPKAIGEWASEMLKGHPWLIQLAEEIGWREAATFVGVTAAEVLQPKPTVPNQWNEPVTTFHVDELRRMMRLRLLHLLEEHPLKSNNLFGLGLWMSRHLDDDDLEAFNAIEKSIGEDKANRWLTSVLIESGQYKSPDGESVELIGLAERLKH